MLLILCAACGARLDSKELRQVLTTQRTAGRIAEMRSTKLDDAGMLGARDEPLVYSPARVIVDLEIGGSVGAVSHVSAG